MLKVNERVKPGPPGGALASRLSALRSARQDPPGAAGERRNAGTAENAGTARSAPTAGFAGSDSGSGVLSGGWEEAAPLVYRRTLNFPLPERWDAGSPVGCFYPELELPPAGEDLVFFDLETTGLSGGAGTLAFLAGTGRLEPSAGGLTLTQLFLADYPGEPDFLRLLSELMPGDKVWVSYNGRAFDSNLLKTRFLMNRMVFPRARQVDLLYPSRRLWKTILPDCSLGTLEREILGKIREQDIPGSLVPQRYFAYLESRDAGLLEPVFAHHREDILSLGELYFLIPPLLEGRLALPHDEVGAAFLLLRHPGLASAGIRRLEEGRSRGNHRAGVCLGLIHKRRGDWARAEEIWADLWTACRSFQAGLELAKIREHRRRDYSGALDIVREMKGTDLPDSRGFRDDLAKREARLLAKLGRG